MAGSENGVAARGSGVYDLAKFTPPAVRFVTRQRKLEAIRRWAAETSQDQAVLQDAIFAGRIDFADEWAPEPYRITGDPEADVMAQMLRLEAELKGIEHGGTAMPLNQAVVESKDLIRRLIAEYDPDQDLSTFSLGVSEILSLFALISGGDTVADAVQEGIVVEMRELAAADRGFDTAPGYDDEPAEEGDDAPLASARRSSASSSPSSDSTDGGPVGGSG